MPTKKPPRSTPVPVFSVRRFVDAIPTGRAKQLEELARQKGVEGTPALPPPQNRMPKGELPGQIGLGLKMPGKLPGDIVTRNPLVHGPITLALPISLTSGFTLASGEASSPPLLPLKSDAPVEIREIVIYLNKPETTAYDQFLGGLISVSLDLEGVPLTTGNIPVAVLCTRDQSELRVGNWGDTLTPNQYTWRLPEPLYIPAGAVLTPVFEHAGFLAESIEIQISYRWNIALGQPAKVQRIPYVAAWTSKSLSASDNTEDLPYYDASDATHLINSTNGPVTIESINGRLMAMYVAKVGVDTLRLALESDLSNHQEDQCVVELRNSNGQQITIEPSPFWQVFEPHARSFEQAFIMPASEYLLASLSIGDVLAAQTTMVGMIAIQGWREVKRA